MSSSFSRDARHVALSHLSSRIGACGLVVLSLVGLSASAFAAQPNKDPLRQGAIYGQVLNTDQKPVADATVALLDKWGHVQEWTRTNADGRYTLATNTIDELHLAPAKHGMLTSMERGFVQVVDLPVQAAHVAVGAAGVVAGAAANTVVGVVKAVNPVGTLKSAAVSVMEGSPVPLATQAVTNLRSAFDGQAPKARSTLATTAINAGPKHDKDDTVPGPGEVTLLVSAPSYQPYQGVAGSYWMEPPGEGPDHLKTGPQAWLDTVALSPDTDTKAHSSAESQSALLKNPTLSPAFAAAGTPVQISVQLDNPADPACSVAVVAREQKTHAAVLLTPQGDGVYSGALQLPRNCPLGDTIVTVAALNMHPVTTSLPKNQGDPLLKLAENMDDLDPGNSYRFNPGVMASENRIDLKIRVLNPSLETPPLPSPPSNPQVVSAVAPAPPAAADPATAPAAPSPVVPPLVKTTSETANH